MLQGLLLGLIGLIIISIRRLYWNATREKLSDEKEKSMFLNQRFQNVLNVEITEELDSHVLFDVSELKLKMKKNRQKNGTLSNLIIAQPKKSTGDWGVYIDVKSGTWPISNKEIQYNIYSIADDELSSLEEFKEFKTSMI